jgi:acetyl esterase/lipase
MYGSNRGFAIDSDSLMIDMAQMSALAERAREESQCLVSVVRNLSYLPEPAPPKGRLDLYLPKVPRGFPVILSIHGGALLEGDKSSQEFVGQRFAAAGIGVAVINYRLSPGVSHPVHVQDVAAAFAWVKRFISEFGGLADRVFLVGHSAGAYLATLLATDGRYLTVHRLAPKDIRGLVAVSGFFWVDRIASERPKSVWGESKYDWLDASPPTHLTSGLPPTLLLYADGDDAARRRQNIDMAQAVRASGNLNLELVQMPGRDHSSLWQRIAEPGDEVAERILSFVRGQG